MGIIRKAFSIGTTGGLIGFRSKPEKVARNIRLTAKAARQQNVLLLRQNQLIEQQTAALVRRQEPVVPVPVTPVAPPIASEPLQEELNPVLVRKAADIVVKSQLASRRMLREELRVSYVTVGRVMEALEASGVVSPTDEGGERDVLLSQDNLDERYGSDFAEP